MPTLTDIQQILAYAVDIKSESDRQAFVRQACGGNKDLERHIHELIASYFQAGAFLEAPAHYDLPTNVTDGPDADETGCEAPGTMIGPYKLLEQIGAGGMGTVYVAEQKVPVRRTVALKVIKPGMDTREVIARFEAERQALAMMNHPSIAKVLDAGSTAAGRPYFVMELVKGVPITEFCDQHKLDTRERLKLFITLCQAVQHAHQKGLIHRDIKPSNLLVEMHDVTPVPKVIDFGVAKAIGHALTEKTLHTGFSQLVGTPLYMSPEQAGQSSIDVDTRSDVYSLGVLLYEMLTGHTPFESETLRKAGLDEMRRIIREVDPPLPSARVSTLQAQALSTVSERRQVEPHRLGQQLRGELDWIVMKALEKDRSRRYESASALAADVQRYLNDEPVSACPPSAVYRVKKLARRNRAALVTVSLVTVALLAGTAVSVWQAIEANAARKSADDNATLAGERLVLADERLKLADERLQEVTAEKQRADDERAIAVAVNDFILNDLLAQAAPGNNPRANNVTVEELLERAAARIAGKFGTQPLIEAAIRQTIGDVYRALGDYPAAQPHLERALELYRDQLGDEHPDTLGCTNNLAVLYQHQGQYAKAELLQVKVLEVCRRIFGERHPNLLTSMNNLAQLYQVKRQYDKAEPLFVELLELSRGIPGWLEDPATLQSENNLAGVYQAQGEYAKAEPIYVRALEVNRRVLGEEHPQTLISMNNLASLYHLRAQYIQAESLYAETVEISRRVLGVEHPDTLNFTGNLAVLHMDQGLYATAEPSVVKALEVLRRVLGEEHSATLNAMNNLARLYYDQGQYAQAEPLYREAVQVARDKLGFAHPNTQMYIRGLAGCYARLRKPEESERLSRELVAYWKERAGADSPQYADELTLFGQNLLYEGKYTEAEAVLRECLVIREQQDPDVWTTFNAKSMLGGSLLGQSNFAGAEPLLLSGYQGLKDREAKIVAAGRHRLSESLERLVQLYTAWGKDDQAAPWRQELERRPGTEAKTEKLEEQRRQRDPIIDK